MMYYDLKHVTPELMLYLSDQTQDDTEKQKLLLKNGVCERYRTSPCDIRATVIKLEIILKDFAM